MNLAAKLGAAAAGALAMYYLDPQSGAQRRAAFAQLLASGLPGTAGHRNRLARRSAQRISQPDAQQDAQLRGLIQSRLGRLVSHPRALDVRVENGVVRLSGHVLEREREGLLLQVQEMPGVQRLVNAMTAHETPEGIAREAVHEDAGAMAAAA